MRGEYSMERTKKLAQEIDMFYDPSKSYTPSKYDPSKSYIPSKNDPVPSPPLFNPMKRDVDEPLYIPLIGGLAEYQKPSGTIIRCRTCTKPISIDAKYPPCPHCGDMFVTEEKKTEYYKVVEIIYCRACTGKVEILGRDNGRLPLNCPHCKDPYITEERKKYTQEEQDRKERERRREQEQKKREEEARYKVEPYDRREHARELIRNGATGRQRDWADAQLSVGYKR